MHSDIDLRSPLHCHNRRPLNEEILAYYLVLRDSAVRSHGRSPRALGGGRSRASPALWASNCLLAERTAQARRRGGLGGRGLLPATAGRGACGGADHYFEKLQVERVEPGKGCERITALPPLFPDVAVDDRRKLATPGAERYTRSRTFERSLKEQASNRRLEQMRNERILVEPNVRPRRSAAALRARLFIRPAAGPLLISGVGRQ